MRTTISQVRPINTPLAELSAVAAKQPPKTSTAKKIAIGTLLLGTAVGTAVAAYVYKRDAIEQKFPGSMTGLEEKVSQAQAKMTEGLDKIEARFPKFGPVRSTIADLPNKLPSKDEVNAFVNPVITKANDLMEKASDLLNQANNYLKGAAEKNNEEEPGIEEPKPGIEEPKPCIEEPKPCIEEPKPSAEKPKLKLDFDPLSQSAAPMAGLPSKKA